MTTSVPRDVIAFVSSIDRRDANHRLWFTTVPDALGKSAVRLDPSALPEFLRTTTGRVNLVCMYKDLVVLDVINNLPEADRDRLRIGVIVSDVYAMDFYFAWAERAAFYLAPTPEHRAVIRSFLPTEVFVVNEPLDPMADVPFPREASGFDGWLYWFGYPESFDKGMRHLLPVIGSAVDDGKIRGLRVVTSELISELPWIEHIRYSDETLPRILATAQFILLSHFAYDLHVNSSIKTDNKALLTLHAGAIPIASDTPGYGRLLRRIGLHQCLFDGPAGLHAILSNLASQPPQLSDHQRLLIDDLLAERSAASTATKIQYAFAAI